MVQVCREVGSYFNTCSFTHVRREGNRVAHEPAKNNTGDGLVVWVEYGPPNVVNLAALDVLSVVD